MNIQNKNSVELSWTELKKVGEPKMKRLLDTCAVCPAIKIAMWTTMFSHGSCVVPWLPNWFQTHNAFVWTKATSTMSPEPHEDSATATESSNYKFCNCQWKDLVSCCCFVVKMWPCWQQRASKATRFGKLQLQPKGQLSLAGLLDLHSALVDVNIFLWCWQVPNPCCSWS